VIDVIFIRRLLSEAPDRLPLVLPVEWFAATAPYHSAGHASMASPLRAVAAAGG
jgi:hypothetical protein